MDQQYKSTGKKFGWLQKFISAISFDVSFLWSLRLELIRKTMSITKISLSGLKTLVANFFVLTNSIYLVIKRILIIKYNLYLSFSSMKLILPLFKVRNNIFREIFILMSINKKVSSKNQNLLFISFTKKEAITIPQIPSILSLTKKEAITIPKIPSILLSIFCIPMSIF